MSETNFFELLKQSLKIGHSELTTKSLKKVFLLFKKQNFKTTFPNIYDSMEAEMHEIDIRLIILLIGLIQGLLFELQDHLEPKQYEELKEVLDLWGVRKKYN